MYVCVYVYIHVHVLNILYNMCVGAYYIIHVYTYRPFKAHGRFQNHRSEASSRGWSR